VSPVKYKLGFYIPEDGIFHSHRRKALKYYTILNLIRRDISLRVLEYILG
jgi:hypothetical protein